ncbi:hypothetical protein DSO57_1018571 [Entomophthora muscae]|uniref:Uncharacterized protein n=1 Tax=Entomophthora muscae TaxID=34485 RepID=A0ACC2UDS5_9FUNG|nr:hypothetical protein DSO57_1018571 [Entomophthora muscae]
MLLQRLAYLKYYLGSVKKASGEVDNDLTKAQKAAWDQRNLRYPLAVRSLKDRKDFHILTLYVNNIVEAERLKRAESIASSPRRDARTIGKFLATSIFTCIEFQDPELLQFYSRNIAFMAQFGSVVPLSWYTPEFLDALFSRFSREVEILDPQSGDIIANTLKVWSYWVRRADIPSSKTVSKQILACVQEAIHKVLALGAQEVFEKSAIRTCIHSTMIILPKLSEHFTSDSEADVIPNILNSGMLDYIKGTPTGALEAQLGDAIQAAIASLLQNETSDPKGLVEAYLSNQSSLSLHLPSAPENALIEQGMKVFSLSQFHILQLSSSHNRLLSNPYAWAPFTTLAHQLFFDDDSSRISSLFALGGSYLGLKSLSLKQRPSFQGQIEECFSSCITHQLEIFKGAGLENDAVWSALAIVLSRCIDEKNFTEMMHLTSGPLRHFMTTFFIHLIGQYSPAVGQLEYDVLSESPLFRETGRISKLVGRILVSHLDLDRVQAFSGVRALFGLLSSGPQSSHEASQTKFKSNLAALQQLVSFSKGFHASWDGYFKEKLQESNYLTSDGLRKCLRSALFAYTLILQVVIMRSSTVAAPSDLEVEHALLALYNIHFCLVIQTPRVMFNGHNNVCSKVFSLAGERPHLMSKLLSSLNPYKGSSEALLQQESLPEKPNSSFTFQSKELFYFWFLENTMAQLTGEQVEEFVLPLIQVYLSSRQPWSRDLFESAHTIVLAMFKHINHPILGKFAPWYQQQLLMQFPKWLTTEQFRIAYTLMVEGLARQEEIGGHAVWALIRYMADKVCQDDKGSPEAVPGYFQTFVKLLPSVPITYLPAFTHRVETLALSLSSPSSGGLALEAAAKLVFDVVSQETLSTTHKSFAIPWYMRFLKVAAPRRK